MSYTNEDFPNLKGNRFLHFVLLTLHKKTSNYFKTRQNLFFFQTARLLETIEFIFIPKTNTTPADRGSKLLTVRSDIYFKCVQLHYGFHMSGVHITDIQVIINKQLLSIHI